MGAAASTVDNNDDDVFVYMGGEQQVPMEHEQSNLSLLLRSRSARLLPCLYRMYDLRDEMDADINRSYGISVNAPIQQCIRTVLHRLEYWRVQHNMLLNGAMAEIDLALRTIQGSSVMQLEENENEKDERPDVAVGYDRRDEAGVVIRNVLSFLML